MKLVIALIASGVWVTSASAFNFNDPMNMQNQSKRTHVAGLSACEDFSGHWKGECRTDSGQVGNVDTHVKQYGCDYIVTDGMGVSIGGIDQYSSKVGTMTPAPKPPSFDDPSQNRPVQGLVTMTVETKWQDDGKSLASSSSGFVTGERTGIFIFSTSQISKQFGKLVVVSKATGSMLPNPVNTTCTLDLQAQ